MKHNRILIDADILVYRYGQACTEDCFGTTVTLIENAKAAFRDKLEYIKADYPGHSPMLALSNGKCFRYDIFKAYKAHRSPTPDVVRELKEWVRSEYANIMLESPSKELVLEADDILGLHCGPGDIIMSDDKDMLTIPGRHAKFHSEGEVFVIPETIANGNFWEQVLTGDSADGYIGCRGIGPSAANRILEAALKAGIPQYDACLLTYLSNRQTEEDLIVSCRLAYIYRKGDNPDKLWEPPTREERLRSWFDFCEYLGTEA